MTADDEMWNLQSNLLEPQVDEGIGLGEYFFEGSDAIGHQASLSHVCVCVAGQMGDRSKSIAREQKRRPAWGTRAARALLLLSWGRWGST
jgi:hypothetical protein